MMKDFAKVKIKYLVSICLSVLIGVVVYGVSEMDEPTVASMCKPNDYEIRIIDDSVTSEVREIKFVGDPHFKAFITSLTDYVLSKFSDTASCRGNSNKSSVINLIFVRLPLVTSGDEPMAVPPRLNISPSDLTCRLDSPWAKIAVRRSSNSSIDAIFIWNERQFLLDQVFLSGDRPSVTQPLLPLSNSLFEGYAADYAKTEIEGIPSGDNAQTNISKRIPADVLWLFGNSPRTTFIPFSSVARSQMQEVLKRGASGYTALNKALIDQCFSSGKTDIHYKNILDLNKVFSLDQYRVN